MRGTVERARTYIKMNTEIFRTNQIVGRIAISQDGPNNGPFQPPKKRIVAIQTVAVRLPYSASMYIANFIPLYSVCHPPTSSCSDSARSNGSRFVSAVAHIE